MATTAITVSKWDALDHPDCENCHGLSRPIRPKSRKPFDCGLVQLAVHPLAKLRAHANALPAQAGMTRDEFVQRILGRSPAPFWKQVSCGTFTAPVKQQLQAIECIERNGACVTVVYRVGSQSKRWAATLAIRERKAHPLPPTAPPLIPGGVCWPQEDLDRIRAMWDRIGTGSTRGRPLKSAQTSDPVKIRA